MNGRRGQAESGSVGADPPGVVEARWALIVPVRQAGALPGTAWQDGPICWPIDNEPGRTTNTAWRSQHEEQLTVAEVVAKRTHSHGPRDSVPGLPELMEVVGFEHLPGSAGLKEGLLVMHLVQRTARASLQEVQEAIFTLRGPGWQGSGMVHSICAGLGLEPLSPHGWFLLTHMMLTPQSAGWIPSGSLRRALAAGWSSRGYWKEEADPRSGHGAAISWDEGPFRSRTLTVEERGVAHVLVGPEDPYLRRQARHKGLMFTTHYLDVVLLHLKVHFRVRQIERAVSMVDDPVAQGGAVDELAGAMRHLRAVLWTYRPSHWSHGNHLFRSLQEAFQVRERVERLRDDLTDFEAALEREYRSRVDGMLLVIAVVSALASAATITGVALAYWTIARPENVDVEAFAGWWVFVPGLIIATAVGYELGRHGRRHRRKARPSVLDATSSG